MQFQLYTIYVVTFEAVVHDEMFHLTYKKKENYTYLSI